MKARDSSPQLPAAIASLQQGDRGRARALLSQIVRADPDNLAAWNWACEIAESREEKIRCLQHILRINPDDQDARITLDRMLGGAGEPPAGGGRHGRASSGQSCVATATWLFAALVVVIMVGTLVYSLPRSNFFGLRGPDFDSLTISESFDQVQSDDYNWEIIFERRDESTFAGLVRHASPIRIGNLRILTHDILVTAGEYADPKVVSTSVSNHRFTWYSEASARPDGRINLLHTVPANEEVFQQLKSIESGNQVRITGQEISKIKIYEPDGQYRGDWHDEGCNTILVYSVQYEE